MAVTLSGKVLAMIAKLEVMRAAAPNASTTRTARQIAANGTPSGLPSTNLSPPTATTEGEAKFSTKIKIRFHEIVRHQ